MYEKYKKFINFVNRNLFARDYKIDLSSSIIVNFLIFISLTSKGGRCYNHEVVSFAKSSAQNRNFSAIAERL